MARTARDTAMRVPAGPDDEGRPRQSRPPSTWASSLAGFGIQGLDHVALTVRDQAASERWDTEVLGLERARRGGVGQPTRCSSIYFDDPDGRRLELTTYEV